MVKNFILNFGTKLLDVIVILSLIFVTLVALGVMFSQSFVMGLIVLVAGLIQVIVIFYLIYLFVDIRDLLKQYLEKQAS